jgi:hypothetical protein
MTPAEINSLVFELQKHSPLGRLSLSEAKQVLQTLQGWGYTITAPATPPVAAH